MTTTTGGVFRWANSTLSKLIDDPVLSDQNIYSIAPLDDETIVIASNRGAYRYVLAAGLLQHFGPLNGFLGI